MSINQISTSNTFGQLVTTISALVAVSNNFTDGPQSQTDSTWTFTNSGVGVNVPNTALIGTVNVGVLNASLGNVTTLTVSTLNSSTANLTVANVGGATIGNVFSSRVTTTNANVTLLQVDRINTISMNAQSANISALSLDTLNVTGLTVAQINTSFANITDALITGTFQAIAIQSTLITSTNANVGLVNMSTANITNETVGRSNISSANITNLTVGTLNVSTANITTATFPTVNTSSANATVAAIGTLSATNATITNLTVSQINASIANITTGTVASSPSVNNSIATKVYVDTGAGANLVSKISFNSKGDLVVGTGANTYVAQNVGSNGLALISDSNMNTGVRWTQRASNLFRGLYMGTSQADKDSNGRILVVHNLDEAIMNDGEVVREWQPRAQINALSSGVNGLDTGTLLANTWYEVHAIRSRSTGNTGFLLHRCPDRNPDQNTSNIIAFVNVAAGIGVNTASAPNVNVAMSFTPNVSGNVTSIEIRAFKAGTPTGECWIRLRANTAGIPDANIIAESRRYDVARVQGSPFYPIRFVFDNSAPVVSGTSYFWSFESTYTASDAARMNVAHSTVAQNGANGVNAGVPLGNNGGSWVNLTPGVGCFIYKVYIEANASSLTMPSGYDQNCLISYVATDEATRLREYRQQDRTIHTFMSKQWVGHQITFNTIPDVADFRFTLPPVPVHASFLGFHTGGTAHYLGFGLLNCVDIPGQTYAETYGFVPSTLASTGAIASPPSQEIWIEHQATYVRIGTSTTAAVSKIYPITFRF